ncbi:MAG: DUF1232 domain-containing protein [bacterium]|nr:hypothetical protein [Deltaproteobacteria bacterium]MCP4907586.1 DUF1232 domain-containing protein [bacterium]
MNEPMVTIELNPREQRLYDRLRRRIVEPDPKARTGTRDLVLLLPDLTILLLRLLRDTRVPLLEKGIAVAGVAYVLSPIDVLPALLIGPIGLLDDLFIVAACLSRLLNHVHPDVVRGHWSGQGDVLGVIQATSDWFEKELRLRVGDLRKRLGARRFS